MSAFLAIDWGTTNRRVHLIDASGAVIASERDDRGVLAIPAGGFGDEIDAIRARLGDHPMLCAGMVGSTRGWVETPYLPCPADVGDLARGLHWVEPGRTAIVPGLSVTDGVRGDVMRGEEVQLLGAVAAGLAPADALLCQPGTHCKWARMGPGGVTRFHTTLTGELFALLGRHSLLAEFLTGAVTAGLAFADGLAATRDATLLRDLFGVRASALLGLRAREGAASYVSGLLIGADVREQDLVAGQPVHLLADAALAPLYAAAIASTGAVAVSVDSHAAFVAGITAIWKDARVPSRA